MTCIVGIADGSNVYMGGDRGASDEHTIVSIAQPKVKVNGLWIHGYSGSLGNGQLLDFINFPATLKKTDDPYKIIKFDIVPQIKALMESHGSIKDDDATDYLIGCKGRLFELSSEDWGVAEVEQISIGSGNNYALGSLYSTIEIDNPIVRITIALNAAITYSPTCQGPCDVLYI